MEDVRRGAIAELYKKSNRELAAEVDALRNLVLHMTKFIDDLSLNFILKESDLLRKIMEDSDGISNTTTT